MKQLSNARILTAAAAGFTAIALLAGCSSSGLSAQEQSLGGPSPAQATDMPDASDLTPAGTLVAAGKWAVVQITDDTSTPATSTLAIKVGALRKGDPDDLKDVQVMNGEADSTQG